MAEFEAYPEPKVLAAVELKALRREPGTNRRVGARIGGTQGFVRDVLASAKS